MRSKQKTTTTATNELPSFSIEPSGDLWRAVRIVDGVATPLVSPYGAAMERRMACREASNALYRELCLGLTRIGDGDITPGLSPSFKITSR